ncbi:GspE/PulE family protein, partial [Patescibacteria group bacterium AH-259-L05]|nr:GspE/PulE family protein [Patescibacteria group bacterium AH-259-L05]
LVDEGKLTNEHYQNILAEAQKVNLDPVTLLEKKRIVTEEEVALAKSKVYNVPVAELYGVKIDRKVLELIPKETAENYQIVAFKKESGTLHVAIINPGNFKAREAGNFVGRENSLEVAFYIAPISAIKNLLAQYTGLAMEVEEAVGAAESRFAPTAAEGEPSMSLEEISKSAPITKLVGSILKYAVDNSASDIHIEPMGEKTRVRYRIDGVLRETASLPGHLHSAIISRIKVMASLKLDETRIPQDGRIRVTVSKRRVDMRVSIFPLLNKEKAVMRVLDPERRVFELKDLGFWGRGNEAIQRNMARPHGMILITGPTGCGKSTTLYAVLKQLSQPGVNIITLEDPVEYFLPGVNQSQVRPEIGYSFASGLRSVVRQDPDIIMVGEIRDKETADLATHAALTGHIVLSTLHTNDAFGAVPRLVDMGIEKFLIASSVNLIVAQRLVRTICSYCKTAIEISDEVEKTIETALKNTETNIDKYRDKKTGRLIFYRGKECSRCNNEGYSGRTGIFEALEITDNMQNIINGDLKLDDVKAEFKRQKMKEMVVDGYIKALEGITTIEEVLRAARE